MNILSIGGRYKPTNGGNAKRISTMCEAFSRLGHKVTVMTCDGYSAGTANEVIENVTVKRYADCNALTASVLGVIASVGADILLVHEETYLRKLRSVKVNVPVVYECHAIEPNKSKVKELVLKIVRKTYFSPQYLKRVFVLSQNAKKEFAKKFSYPYDCIVCTPNGLYNANSYASKMRFGEGESFIYGYSGTLYEFQGIKVLLQYAKDILVIAPDVKIMIVGGGPMEDEVRAFVAENSLEDRIIVTGSVSQEKFDELTQTFDVMLMPRPSTPSTESAVPLKIFDAAMHKKPVVMSNVSGLTEAFSEKAALIYNTKTPDDFVECCKMLYRNGELAQCLVKGEEEALAAWPTVDDVAKMQLDAMKSVHGGGTVASPNAKQRIKILVGRICAKRSHYDNKYLTGKWFTAENNYIGWNWVIKNARECHARKVNQGCRFPVCADSRVAGAKNIEFHPDDLNNFQHFGCYFQGKGKITIGRGTWIAPNVGIITANHNLTNLEEHDEAKPVTIGENCWIGMNSMILPGVELGPGTVVGAGAVVTKSFKEGHCVIAGNPARLIKKVEM